MACSLDNEFGVYINTRFNELLKGQNHYSSISIWVIELLNNPCANQGRIKRALILPLILGVFAYLIYLIINIGFFFKKHYFSLVSRQSTSKNNKFQPKLT
mgnify:CR=1 FL=1